MIKSKLAALLLVASTLASCKSVGPSFLPPIPDLPTGSFEPARASNSVAETSATAPSPDANPDWWTTFRDPILTDLESQVAGENLDVLTATVRIAESRFQRGVVAAAELPTINGQAKYQRELYSSNGVLSLVNGLLPTGTPLAVQPFNEFTVGTDASWQLDLWGGVRRQIEAADAQSQASEDERRAALVTSFAELANDYLNLRGAQALAEITNENLRAEQDILQLTQDRQQRGLATGLDVESAASQVDSVRAQLPELAQQISQSSNAVALLLAMPPDALNHVLDRARPAPPAPTNIPLGVPSELARRRPDIQEAEARLHAATADIGVAVAAFYPSVQLSGSIELDALHLGNWFTPGSLQYAAGPSITLPIFEGGRLKSTLDLRAAQQVEAAIAYRKTVLQAWHEVVNALVAIRTERTRRARLADQVGHAREALTLARARYANGVADMTTVLDNERTLLAAQQDYVQSTTNLSLDAVQLYKALGGGWENYPSGQKVALAADAH
jgi:NodT family efflux transporter outer membrane factor (OMF) lipoprotein